MSAIFAANICGFPHMNYQTTLALGQYARPPYNARHLIENLFAKLQAVPAIVTRYDKTAGSVVAPVHLVASAI